MGFTAAATGLALGAAANIYSGHKERKAQKKAEAAAAQQAEAAKTATVVQTAVPQQTVANNVANEDNEQLRKKKRYGVANTINRSVFLQAARGQKDTLG